MTKEIYTSIPNRGEGSCFGCGPLVVAFVALSTGEGMVNILTDRGMACLASFEFLGRFFCLGRFRLTGARFFFSLAAENKKQEYGKSKQIPSHNLDTVP